MVDQARSWRRPGGRLLPQEPAPAPRRIRKLTAQLLAPAETELMTLFLALRAETDALLGAGTPAVYGKPYPHGYCQEITRDVLARLGLRISSPVQCRGSAVLRAFLSAGGEVRCVWGILRGKYFQTALQIGALYVDVSNDTVVPTKPKVEILPMVKAGLEAVRDAWHFAQIAESYWDMRVYANHALPSLAPIAPMIGVDPRGGVTLQSPSDYMAGLFQRDGFRSAEAWLGTAALPPASVIAQLRARASPELLAANPNVGGEAASAACRSARERGLATDPAWLSACLAECTRLHSATQSQVLEKHSMPTLNLDGRAFEIGTLPELAKAQVTSIQFVDGEIARLQAQLAAMQTARNAYLEALRRALPEA